jgi:hypothetical protein
MYENLKNNDLETAKSFLKKNYNAKKYEAYKQARI